MFALFLASILCYEEIEPIEIPEGLSNSDACAVCKTVISGITDILDNTKVQTAVTQLASELCKKFSLTAAQNLCKTIIGEYLPKVLSFIAEGVNKLNICTKLGLCKSNDAIEEYEEIEYIAIPEGLENGIACSICQHLVKGISNIIASTTAQTKVTELAQKICARFPTIGRNFCNKLVTKYVPKLMTWISQGITKLDICTKIKICKSNDFDEDAYLQLYLEMDDDEEIEEMELPEGLDNFNACNICKGIVNVISSLLKNSLVQSAISSAATAACTSLTSGVGLVFCKGVVKVFLKPILNWLGNKLASSSVCTKIKICKSNADEEFYLDFFEDDDEEIEYIAIPEGLENGIACSICQHLVKGISSIIASTTAQTKVTELAQKICARFPTIGRNFCNKLVTKYVPKLMTWISQGITKLDICTKIKICKSNDFDEDAYLQLYLEMDDDEEIEEMELPEGLDNFNACNICKGIVNVISSLLKNSLVQSAISSAATAACTSLTSGVGLVFCKGVVKVFLKPILNWLGNKLASSSVCTKIKICKSNADEEFYLDFVEDDDEEIYIAIPEGIDNVSACSVCKTVVNGVSNILKNTKVQSQVASLAANLCKKVPAVVQGICKTIVTKYLPNLMSWLGSGLTTLDVCKKFHLC
ncbi:surfactant B protein [Histomonas meleagridis]|uniref:surfactant B protein n=1 Tax=Histomonas meleagridis TaxID=135588 RepID=UPI003559CF80|nr:surfactant B protein [Histomonas meleagridis]